MRLLVNCPSGESRLLQVSGGTTVSEVKQLLEEQEGQHLKDHLTLDDYYLEAFTLSAEVVLYLSQCLASPKRIYLTSQAKRSQLVAEEVESDMPVIEILGLLERRGLGCNIETPSRPVLVKRQDGSMVPVDVNAAEGLDHLEQRITQQQGVTPSALTFYQAQDGSLHCSVWPSATASANTYPVYQRSTAPQPVMPVCAPSGDRQPLMKLVHELCVLP